MYAAWTVKHKPKSTAEVVGNQEAIRTLEKWLKSWEKAPPKQKAAFLHGPPGVGKTLTVEALAQDLGMELLEKNASDCRTEARIRKFAGLASQFHSFSGRKRLILLDEMDGVHGTADRGAIPAITRIVRSTSCPIILTANDFWNKKFTPFRSKTNYLIIEFKKPPAGEILKHLKRICKREGIKADEEALKFVAHRSGGDVRSAVVDLQAFTQGKKTLTFDDISWLAHRDRKDVIFSVLRSVLYGKTCISAKQAMDMADVSFDMLFEWIYENAPHHFNIPGELAKAMEALALADLYITRIRRTRNWKLMRYAIDFMTAGVAMARDRSKPSGWIPFRFPQRIRSLSASRGERMKKRQIGQKIKARMHISAVLAQRDVLPYLRIIFESSPSMAAGLATDFGFDEEEIQYVAGGKRKANAIMKSMG